MLDFILEDYFQHIKRNPYIYCIYCGGSYLFSDSFRHHTEVGHRTRFYLYKRNLYFTTKEK